MKASCPFFVYHRNHSKTTCWIPRKKHSCVSTDQIHKQSCRGQAGNLPIFIPGEKTLNDYQAFMCPRPGEYLEILPRNSMHNRVKGAAAVTAVTWHQIKRRDTGLWLHLMLLFHTFCFFVSKIITDFKGVLQFFFP